MIHYHVWFNLKAGIDEESGLRMVSEFLSRLSNAGEAQGFRILKNLGGPPRSKLPAYHALIEFADSAALDRSMRKQAERGIHTGGHGKVVEVVRDFHVETFSSVEVGVGTKTPQACEI
jgi:hypothetical protein